MSEHIDGTLYRSTKTFSNLPCAHRAWRHDGHCKFVHGYSRSIHFTFEADSLDACGFVVDFSKLKKVKAWLEDWFDHTLLLNPDDPLLSDFLNLEVKGGAKVRVMPYGCGMEGSARFVLEEGQRVLDMEDDNRARKVRIVSIEMRENDKNSAIYYSPFDS